MRILRPLTIPALVRTMGGAVIHHTLVMISVAGVEIHRHISPVHLPAIPILLLLDRRPLQVLLPGHKGEEMSDRVVAIHIAMALIDQQDLHKRLTPTPPGLILVVPLSIK
jgi:hypothetical protein